MNHVTVPELEDWLERDTAPLFPFKKTFEEARYDTFVVSHTSGSRDVPELIEVKHGTFAAQDFFQTFPSQGAPPRILEDFRNIRMHLALPLFHAAAYMCFFSAPVFYSMTSVVTPAVPLTAEIADAVHRFGNVQACCVPPSILVDISKTPSYLENVNGMEFVMYGGGPLPKDAGDIIQATGTTILSLLGTTETMLLPLERPDKEDWEYHRFSSHLGAEFRYRWDDLYDMFIVRDPKLDLGQGVFATFPNLREYTAQDLYSKHPTKPGLWRHRGRTDDVIAFVNGEKSNPLTMEGIIGSHPEVKSALVFGAGRFQGVLIELKQPLLSFERRSSLLLSIWPYIARANQGCPAHGQILNGMTIFTREEKPVMRDAEGTVQRGKTIDLYRAEIDALYEDNPTSTERSRPASINFQDQTTLRTSLRRFFAEEIGLKGVEDYNDLFSAGLDSLQALNSTKHINAAAQKQGLYVRVAPKTVYNNPTIAKLTSKILALEDEIESEVSEHSHSENASEVV